jgi:hypothetical protein
MAIEEEAYRQFITAGYHHCKESRAERRRLQGHYLKASFFFGTPLLRCEMMSLMSGQIHKISILANGDLLFNGKPATQTDIVSTLDSGQGDAVVWYYREDAASAAPPHTLEVLRIVAERRLPVRFFTKPDFSDTRLPHAAGEFALVFESARKRAMQAQLVIVRPDSRQLGFAAVPKQSVAKQALDEVERILSSATKRNVAVIAETAWTMAEHPTLLSAAGAIPFMGLLIGLACIGHAVWVFDWTSAMVLGSACADADLMIVDETRLELLPQDWKSIARSAMRTPKIFVYKREGRQLVPTGASGTDHDCKG